MKILAFGEILWDIINGEEHLGGAPFNFAAHSARCGNETYIVSRVADDYRGIKAFNQCRDLGVNNELIQWDYEHPTGTVQVTLENGQPDYVILENVAYDYISFDNKISALPRQKFDMFYFGSLAQRNDVSADTLHAILRHFSFKHIFYDVNLRKNGYNKKILSASLSTCTILKLNTDEVAVLNSSVLDLSDGAGVEGFCNAIQEKFPTIQVIILTASEKGCYVFRAGRLSYIPGKKVKVKDAVGAGDAFSAAFMHIFYQTDNAQQAAHIANGLGAFVASERGPVPVYTQSVKAMLTGDRRV